MFRSVQRYLFRINQNSKCQIFKVCRLITAVAVQYRSYSRRRIATWVRIRRRNARIKLLSSHALAVLMEFVR